jgi:hypothetical protein
LYEWKLGIGEIFVYTQELVGFAAGTVAVLGSNPDRPKV